jgi:hypothetical protein
MALVSPITFNVVSSAQITVAGAFPPVFHTIFAMPTNALSHTQPWPFDLLQHLKIYTQVSMSRFFGLLNSD